MKKEDYLFVLKALKEMPFNPGRKLLKDYLQGETSESIIKNRLNKYPHFGTLAYNDQELNNLISGLEVRALIEQIPLKNNKFIKVFKITKKGLNELENPNLVNESKETKITDFDKEMFKNFDFFLNLYNDEQKKAIISNERVILCIAGAGSGKTTVLTRRIEFLIRFKAVAPEKILAITFTRKARQEMTSRLEKNGCNGVKVETFNSFCEKFLKRNNDRVYEKEVRMIKYPEKIRLLRMALDNYGVEIGDAIDLYFSNGQKKLKSNEELFRIFLNDCFFIIDYYKANGKEIEKFYTEVERSAKMVYHVCMFISEKMEEQGLRDFTDQIVDVVKYLEKNRVLSFEHILVDEYQDVNALQIKFIDLLNWKSLFCVGDPRQAIYGWRGSQVKYILNFKDKYKDAEVINLKKNYRSNKKIVDISNEAIKGMGLCDLESVRNENCEVKLLKFDSDLVEFEFVVQRILNCNLPREEIFVLARTNKQLLDLSKILFERGVKHIIKSEEVGKNEEASDGEVTLATVHAIKGLEAKMVFIIGVTSQNFPCKGSEHPVIDMVKIEDYDKDDEEKRLFYVALSRASESLYLSYSGKRPSSYVNGLMKFFDIPKEQKVLNEFKGYKINDDMFEKLRGWRKGVAEKFGVPAYVIFHDSVLEEICAKRPFDLEDLKNISGIGDSKLRRFGRDVLSVVNS